MKALFAQLRHLLPEDVKFALICRSALTKYFNRDSDVDLAVYFGRKLQPKKMRSFEETLAAAFDEYESDVVFLDEVREQ